MLGDDIEELQCVAASTSCTLHCALQVQEDTTKDTVDDWIEQEPVGLNWDVQVEALVISDDDEIFKVHVHTDIPGQALTESQKYGALDIAKIENMRLQALDLTASILAKENHMPMRVFDLKEENSIVKAASGNFSGTTITV